LSCIFKVDAFFFSAFWAASITYFELAGPAALLSSSPAEAQVGLKWLLPVMHGDAR
jgi:hypothetical protein